MARRWYSFGRKHDIDLRFLRFERNQGSHLIMGLTLTVITL